MKGVGCEVWRFPEETLNDFCTKRLIRKFSEIGVSLILQPSGSSCVG
jgi:hypothetical protein